MMSPESETAFWTAVREGRNYQSAESMRLRAENARLRASAQSAPQCEAANEAASGGPAGRKQR